MTPREIRQLRDRLRMTQEEFARVLGLGDKSQVSFLETGRRRPTGPLLVLLRLYNHNAHLATLLDDVA